VPDNVTLHKGRLDDRLPPWVEKHDDRPISTLGVDSSTRTIFGPVGHVRQPASWIVFDGLTGYRGCRDH
jgi:hypothetical protein